VHPSVNIDPYVAEDTDEVSVPNICRTKGYGGKWLLYFKCYKQKISLKLPKWGIITLTI
jgi:hypothetical protein